MLPAPVPSLGTEGTEGTEGPGEGGGQAETRAKFKQPTKASEIEINIVMQYF